MAIFSRQLTLNETDEKPTVYVHGMFYGHSHLFSNNYLFIYLSEQ